MAGKRQAPPPVVKGPLRGQIEIEQRDAVMALLRQVVSGGEGRLTLTEFSWTEQGGKRVRRERQVARRVIDEAGDSVKGLVRWLFEVAEERVPGSDWSRYRLRHYPPGKKTGPGVVIAFRKGPRSRPTDAGGETAAQSAAQRGLPSRSDETLASRIQADGPSNGESELQETPPESCPTCQQRESAMQQATATARRLRKERDTTQGQMEQLIRQQRDWQAERQELRSQKAALERDVRQLRKKNAKQKARLTKVTESLHTIRQERDQATAILLPCVDLLEKQFGKGLAARLARFIQ